MKLEGDRLDQACYLTVFQAIDGIDLLSMLTKTFTAL